MFPHSTPREAKRERGSGANGQRMSLSPSPAAAHAFARPDRARQSAGKAAKAGRPTLAQWIEKTCFLGAPVMIAKKMNLWGHVTNSYIIIKCEFSLFFF